MLSAAALLACLALPHSTVREVQGIVRALEARYHAATTLQAVFLETYREGHGGIRVESGTVYFQRPGRMRWNYESPEPKLFLVDGKHVWFYVPADHTASRATMRESSDWRTPLALLTGKTRLSRLCGSIDLVTSEDASRPQDRPTGAGDLVLSCRPRGAPPAAARSATLGTLQATGESSEFSQVLIEVDSAYRLVRLLIRQPGNVETEIRFGNWQENIPLPNSLFSFTPPRGVAIVDEASLGDWAR